MKPAAAWPVTTMLFSVFLPVFFTVTGKATGFPTVTTSGDDVATVAVMLLVGDRGRGGNRGDGG